MLVDQRQGPAAPYVAAFHFFGFDASLHDMHKARVWAHSTTFRADLEEVQAVHSLDELLVDELKEDVIVLHDRRPEKQRQSKDLRNEHGRISLWERFSRLFIPRRRRPYSGTLWNMWRGINLTPCVLLSG